MFHKHQPTSLLTLSVLVGLLMLSLALIVPPADVSAQTTISSTFDTDIELWETFGSTRSFAHDAMGGNPGGRICASDNSASNEWFFQAPAAYNGNLSAFYNGSLTFDMNQSIRTDQYFSPDDVVIIGNGVTLIYDTVANPATNTTWTSYYVPLVETAGWINQATTNPVTQTDFQAILADVTALRIRGEYQNGSDTACLDNVRLANGTTPPAIRNRVETNFDVDTDGWDRTGSTRNYGHIATGGNPGGRLCASDNSGSNLWFFLAPAQYLGDLSFAYNGSLSFDLLQDPRNFQLFYVDDIILTGNGVTLTYDVAYNPGSFWTTYYIVMSQSSGWVNQATGNPIPADEFRAVLSKVTEIRIRGEYRDGSDTGCIDNVVLAAPGVVTPPTTPSTVQSAFDADTEGWDLTGSVRDFERVTADGNPGAHICASDNSASNEWFFLAPSPYQGNMEWAYGATLTFSLKQSADTSQLSRTNDVVLVGNNDVILNLDLVSNPGTDWTTYSVTLNEGSGWINEATELAVSADEFRDVLRALRQLRIRGEYRDGSDTGCLDTVTLSSDPDAPTPTPTHTSTSTNTPTPTLTLTPTTTPETPDGPTDTPTLTLTPTLTPTMEISPSPSPTYEVIGDPEIYPPVIRISPTAGQIINNATEYSPRLQWQPVDGAEWYHVYVATTDYSTVVFDQWFPASSVCAVETCTIPEDLWISGSGNFIWWMGYWSESIGDNFANTYNATTFTLSLEAPAPITEPSPSGTISETSVTVRFAADPNVLWYRIWVGPADFSENLLFDWFPASEICTDGICTREVPGTLAAGDYEWYMETWSPGGYVEWFLVSQFTVAP